jgi:RteC protein
MLLEFSETIYAQLEEELEQINGSMKKSVEKLSDAIFAVTGKMNALKKFINDHPFESEADEIDFFKLIKPRFYSWYVYLMEEQAILSAIPAGPDQAIRDYYIQELSFIKRHFTQNAFLYQYFLHEETVKDEEYFLRKNLVPAQLINGVLIIDPGFTTNEDYAFAKFRAYELLQRFILKRIKLLYQTPDSVLLAELLTGNNRRWTGDKVNLIEIAYGIYYTGQMNDGKAEIGDVVSWLEDSLQIDLGRAYRKFVDIRRRKTLSYTKYLDEMRDSIHSKIEENNRYTPKKFNRNNDKNSPSKT